MSKQEKSKKTSWFQKIFKSAEHLASPGTTKKSLNTKSKVPQVSHTDHVFSKTLHLPSNDGQPEVWTKTNANYDITSLDRKNLKAGCFGWSDIGVDINHSNESHELSTINKRMHRNIENVGGHNFQPISIESLAFCDFCGDHIWNSTLTISCYRCEVCRLTCHYQCCPYVNYPCEQLDKTLSSQAILKSQTLASNTQKLGHICNKAELRLNNNFYLPPMEPLYTLPDQYQNNNDIGSILSYNSDSLSSSQYETATSISTATSSDYDDGTIKQYSNKYTVKSNKPVNNDSNNNKDDQPLNSDQLSPTEDNDYLTMDAGNTPFSTVKSTQSAYSAINTDLLFNLNFGGLLFREDYETLSSRSSASTAYDSVASGCSTLSLSQSYDFSTFDNETIQHFKIQVHEVSGEQKYTPKLQYSRAQLEVILNVYNKNDFGLSAKLNGDTFEGNIRIHINLIRPIKMALSSRPNSIYDVINGDTLEDKTDTSNCLVQTTFKLPRGFMKLIHIGMSTTAQVVISSLLKGFQIRDNPQKFSLYEHTIQGDKELEYRKIRSWECPLQIVASWTKNGPESFNQHLKVKRIVLQENETGDIDWNAFSVPELNNFLTILHREEQEYRKEIEMKNQLLRGEITRLLSERRSNSIKSPKTEINEPKPPKVGDSTKETYKIDSKIAHNSKESEA